MMKAVHLSILFSLFLYPQLSKGEHSNKELHNPDGIKSRLNEHKTGKDFCVFQAEQLLERDSEGRARKLAQILAKNARKGGEESGHLLESLSLSFGKNKNQIRYAADNMIVCYQKKGCLGKIEEEVKSLIENKDSSKGSIPSLATFLHETLAEAKKNPDFNLFSAEKQLHSFLEVYLRQTPEGRYQFWGADPATNWKGSHRASWQKFLGKTQAWTEEDNSNKDLGNREDGNPAGHILKKYRYNLEINLKEAVEGFKEVAQIANIHKGKADWANQWLSCILKQEVDEKDKAIISLEDNSPSPPSIGFNPDLPPLPVLPEFQGIDPYSHPGVTFFNPSVTFDFTDPRNQEIGRVLAQMADTTWGGFSAADKFTLAQKIRETFDIWDIREAWEIADRFASERERVPRFIQNWFK